MPELRLVFESGKQEGRNFWRAGMMRMALMAALKGRDMVLGIVPFCRLSAVVDCRRMSSSAGEVTAKVRKRRGAKPSRQLAALMERGSVGQAFLPAIVDVRRQECPRHTGAC